MSITRTIGRWVLDGPLAPLFVIAATMAAGALLMAPVLVVAFMA